MMAQPVSAPGTHLPARAEPPRPRPAAAKAALLLAGAGLGAIIALGMADQPFSQLSAPGGELTFLGNLTALAGTYLALIMVLLISRIPAVERVLGQDGLVRWHKWLAPWPISLLIAHALLTTSGYAQAARTGAWHEAWAMLTQFPDVLLAAVGLGVMCAVGLVSIRAIRQRLSRETWWMIHLCMYLALALSFAHVIALGPSFVGHPLTRVVWSAFWAATAGLVLSYRFGLPVVRSLRHRLVVTEVRQEGPGVVSVICTGRALDALPVAGGQFFCWRFLARGLWWQAHPYSLSALPRPPYLRLTVKAVGGHSASLARLRPGTKVLVEGPYGAFTRQSRHHQRVLLVAGGIGVTALRSLLEDLPPSARPAVVLRVSRPEDLIFRDEIRDLAARRRGTVHEITGPRDSAVLDGPALSRLVPDLASRDVFVCGPQGFVASIVSVAKSLGVPDEAIHHEAFAL